MKRSIALLVIAAACAAAVAGCGLGAGRGTSDATLTVTRDFGTVRVGTAAERKVPGSETAMRMLERHFPVNLRFGGGFVESIDNLSGTSAHRDWFYYVNGIQASVGAAGTNVHHGDAIWWDLHDWSVTDTVPAVVGSYPEPFLNGIGGRRYPTTLQCADETSPACQVVAAAFKRAGVVAPNQELGTGSGSDSIAVIVGTWTELRGTIAGELVGDGPKQSGVYVKVARDGLISLLNSQGQVVGSAGPDGGLVAATQSSGTGPVWLITGTDAAGVLAAARALTPATLHDHFALVVSRGRDLPVPVQGS